MRRTNIYLDEEKLRVLRHLSVLEGGKSSVSDLVRQAVDEFLAVRLAKQDVWGQRLDRLVTRVRDRIPSGLSADDIESDITAASEEVRHEASAGGY